VSKERYTVAVVELEGMTITSIIDKRVRLKGLRSAESLRDHHAMKLNLHHVAFILYGESWAVGDVVTSDGVVQ
jgi:hypothetical protein